MNNPVLERPAAMVTEFDTPELHTLVADMFETMHDAHGVGLAAPQIDVPKRITVIDVSSAEDEQEPTADRSHQSRDRRDGRQTDRRGGLSQHSGIPRAGDAREEGHRARLQRERRGF